jgi:hypothetical protein
MPSDGAKPFQWYKAIRAGIALSLTVDVRARDRKEVP